jgi:hypothetical protein
MADENKRLIPMTIAHTDDNNWRITVEGENSYFVKGDIEDIKKVCRRIKAKDGENNNKCRSAKVGTYLSMVSNSDNEEHKINVWKSRVPHTAEDFKKLMESKEMKTITLTKNYLIEGNIVSKGTLITLKEKLDFLPSDIWEKAKEITDEHERFEFIKSELNKLGDTYSDDEIEDFINKYKSNLNESLTEKEVEGLGDMLDMLEETMESEDYVAKDKIDEILDIASGDEKLLKAWEAMSTADDKTFNKKENAFWSRFDEICKPFKK